MLRPVKPWTWLRALRDQGPPDDLRFWAAMSAMASYLNGRTGSAYVGMKKWARASRMNGRTLAKARDKAIEKGWLHCDHGIRERTKTVYLACVPEHVVLSYMDQQINDAEEVGDGDSENCGTHGVQQIAKTDAAQSAADSAPGPLTVQQITAADADPNLVHSAPKSGALGEENCCTFSANCCTPGVQHKLLEVVSREVVVREGPGLTPPTPSGAECLEGHAEPGFSVLLLDEDREVIETVLRENRHLKLSDVHAILPEGVRARTDWYDVRRVRNANPDLKRKPKSRRWIDPDAGTRYSHSRYKLNS